jgi:quinoprotein glucose dehydrogenase
MRFSLKLSGLLIIAAAILVSHESFVSAQRSPQAGEWRNYFGGTDGTKYSPLSQLNKDNVKDLRIA